MTTNLPPARSRCSATVDAMPGYDFAAVARDNRDKLVRVAIRAGAGRDAEDAVQEAFLAAWARRDQWSPDGNAVALMCGITRHKALNVHQSLKRAVLADFEAEYGDPGHIAPSAFADAPAGAAGDGDENWLSEALSLLSLRQQQVGRMRWANGMTQKAIAEDLGLSLSYVRSVLYAAADLLRAHLLSEVTEP